MQAIDPALSACCSGVFVKTKLSVLHLFLVLASPLLWAGSNCVEMTREIRGMHTERILLLGAQDTQVVLDVRVADDGSERAAGFQHVCPDTIDTMLILFRYPSEVGGRFHMQNVHAPLDIAFFDAAGMAISIQRMETYNKDSRPLYGPDALFQYALEAPAGLFDRLRFREGSLRLVFP